MGDLSGHDDDRQKANVQGNGNQTIQIVGSHNQVTLSGAQALRLIEDGNGDGPKPTPDKGGTAGFTPTGYLETRLLWATNRKSLHFRGRKAEISALWQWLTAENGISAHIITGAGGRGKTRLAVELAVEARAGGWLAGFAGRDAFAPFNSAGSRWAWTQPTLIIVDYVAAQAEALKIALAALVNHPPAQNAPKLRFLLLERSGTPESFWWRHLFGGTDHRDGPIADLLDPSHVIPLQGLAEEDRFAVFAEAYELASGKSAPDRSPAWDQTLAQLSLGGEPLFLAMTGLVLARQGLTAKDGLTADKLAFDLAEQEQKRIETHWIAAGLPKPHARSLPAHLAAVTTLCGGLEEAAAHAMIAEESAALHQAIPSGNTDAAYTALHQALPGDGGAIAPLLPDILGEALILRAFDRLSDKGSAALTRANNRARRAVFETVIRCGRDFIIRGNSLPLDWLKQLHTENEGDVQALIDLANALPQTTVELRGIAAEIMYSLEKKLRNMNNTPLLAGVLNNLSNRLAETGQRDQALHAAKESLNLYCTLANSQPEKFYPKLAMALSSVSSRQAEIGQMDVAIKFAENSVTLYRSLENKTQNNFSIELARALSNYSIILAELGKYHKAINIAQESVDVYKSIKNNNSNEMKFGLSVALNNLSNRQADIGQNADALCSAIESVEVRKSLSLLNIEAFRPHLAVGLNTLSVRYMKLKQYDSALDAAQKSTELLRQLVSEKPDIFRSNLASALNNLSHCYGNVDQFENATEAAMESVGIYRILANQWPSVFLPDLAMALDTLSMYQCEGISDLDKSLVTARESVDVYRSLAAEKPNTFKKLLAGALNTLANRYADLDQHERAENNATESANIYRSIMEERPDAIKPDLVNVLHNLAIHLINLGKSSEAHFITMEALENALPLFTSNPSLFESQVLHLYHNYLSLSEALRIEPEVTFLRQFAEILESLSPGDTQDAD